MPEPESRPESKPKSVSRPRSAAGSKAGPEVRPEALRFLARRPGEVWQGGVFRLPTWIEPRGLEPYRPWCGIWVNVAGQKAHISEPVHPSRRAPEQALESFMGMALDPAKGGGLPERVEVAGPGVAEILEAVLAPLGVQVVRRERLPGVEHLLDAMAADLCEGNPHPGALEPPGMTLERLASFAEAARLFYEAAPWRYLADEDLIRVERPRGPEDLSHALVVGAAGKSFGIMFLESSALHERLLVQEDREEILTATSYCPVFYGPITELPLADSALFEDHRLPVAGPNAYPWALRLGPKQRVRRLAPRPLAHVEAVLRALAATTEGEIDSGRWRRAVPTPDGVVEVALVLPEIVDPPEKRRPGRRAPLDRRAMERAVTALGRYFEHHPAGSIEEMNRVMDEKFTGRTIDEIPSEAATAVERAQDLCYEAFEARGRRKALLARQALEVSRDCADAYVILAEAASGPQEKLRLYGQGVAAGERTLGPERFEERDAPFWGDTKTRPFMRALEGLAQTCVETGQVEEGIGHYQRLLELNPNDNQGVRYVLTGLLLEKGGDAAVARLVRDYKDDVGPSLAYADALLRFRASGDSAASRRALQRAVKLNRFVPPLLLGRARMPDLLPDSCTFGSREEAVATVHELRGSWKLTPGALEWLRSRTPVRRRPSAGRSRSIPPPEGPR